MQISRFMDVIREAGQVGIEPGLRHICNSAGAINYPNAHLDMIRPGLGLFGQHAAPDLQTKFHVKPALSLVSEIVYLKRIRKGEGVSYGLEWKAPEDVWIATVPVGYGGRLSAAFFQSGLCADRWQALSDCRHRLHGSTHGESGTRTAIMWEKK